MLKMSEIFRGASAPRKKPWIIQLSLLIAVFKHEDFSKPYIPDFFLFIAFQATFFPKNCRNVLKRYFWCRFRALRLRRHCNPNPLRSKPCNSNPPQGKSESKQGVGKYIKKTRLWYITVFRLGDSQDLHPASLKVAKIECLDPIWF